LQTTKYTKSYRVGIYTRQCAPGVKWNFWPVIVCHLLCFSGWRNKVWKLLFWCVLCKL